MKVYNKLVRDKIPEIINADNRKAVTRILDDEEYLNELNQKNLKILEKLKSKKEELFKKKYFQKR